MDQICEVMRVESQRDLPERVEKFAQTSRWSPGEHKSVLFAERRENVRHSHSRGGVLRDSCGARLVADAESRGEGSNHAGDKCKERDAHNDVGVKQQFRESVRY